MAEVAPEGSEDLVFEVTRIYSGHREGTSYHSTEAEARSAFADWERRSWDHTTLVYDQDGNRLRWHEDPNVDLGEAVS